MRLDLNCDLGEGEPLARTRALMRWVSSANIACGGHAGDRRSMHACIRLAKQSGVHIGAHPGSWSRHDKGRGPVRATPEDLTLLLLHQVSALAHVAGQEGAALHHVKLHGALYHLVETDAGLARAYARCIGTYWPRLVIYAMAGGQVLRAAARIGVRCRAEGFADRAYQADGRLVPRDRPGAVLDDERMVVARVRELLDGRGLITIEGDRIQSRIDTICVHADSPNAVPLARAIARLLR